MLTTPRKLFPALRNQFLVREKVNTAGVRTHEQKKDQ